MTNRNNRITLDDGQQRLLNLVLGYEPPTSVSKQDVLSLRGAELVGTQSAVLGELMEGLRDVLLDDLERALAQCPGNLH